MTYKEGFYWFLGLWSHPFPKKGPKGVKTRKNCFRYLKLKVKVPRRSLRYVTHRLMVMYPHAKYHWPISKNKNAIMAWTRKYYLKKQLFDLEVKVPRRSLWYATHRLMVMHPHTIYNWPIWKDKKVMVRTSLAEKK